MLLLLLVNLVSGLRLELMYISRIVGQPSLISMVFSCLCCCHSQRNYVYRLYQQNISSKSKVKFREASNRCKRVLKAAKIAYANKTEESILSQKLGSQDFWRIANSVLDKIKPAIPPLFNGLEVFVFCI